MRITNNSIVRNYTRNLNSNLAKLTQASDRVTSQRKFHSMAEDTTSGVRALKLRRVMEQADSYLQTTSTVSSQYASAESQMLKVNDLGQAVAERYTYALNGTNSPDEMKTFSAEISKFRDQILSCANGQFSDRYMFGGSNTADAPFQALKDDNGKVTGLSYNGVNVADIADSEGNVKPEYQYLFEDATFVDIGLGLKKDGNGTIVESSVFQNSLNGLDFLGYGEDNIFLVCNEIIDALDSGSFTNTEYTRGLLDKITTAYKNVTLKVTDLGADTQFLNYSVDRLTDDMNNLIKRQDDLEFIDPADAIMQFKMQEYVYNASMQMGQRLLQPTLFSFIN